MLWTWQNADISQRSVYGGDLPRALRSIRARTIVMPSSTDLYFPPADSQIEVEHLPNAELRVLQSDWDTSPARPDRNARDSAFVEQALVELLATAGPMPDRIDSTGGLR